MNLKHTKFNPTVSSQDLFHVCRFHSDVPLFLFAAALDLHCCMWLFLAGATLCCSAWLLTVQASLVAALGLQSAGFAVVAHRPGTELMSPALAG